MAKFVRVMLVGNEDQEAWVNIDLATDLRADSDGSETKISFGRSGGAEHFVRVKDTPSQLLLSLEYR